MKKVLLQLTQMLLANSRCRRNPIDRLPRGDTVWGTVWLVPSDSQQQQTQLIQRLEGRQTLFAFRPYGKHHHPCPKCPKRPNLPERWLFQEQERFPGLSQMSQTSQLTTEFSPAIQPEAHLACPKCPNLGEREQEATHNTRYTCSTVIAVASSPIDSRRLHPLQLLLLTRRRQMSTTPTTPATVASLDSLTPVPICLLVPIYPSFPGTTDTTATFPSPLHRDALLFLSTASSTHAILSAKRCTTPGVNQSVASPQKTCYTL